MSTLFKTSTNTQAANPSPLSGLSIQSSGYGKPLPILIGTQRISPQLIWYGHFQSHAQQSQSQQQQGSKGGIFGGTSNASNGSITYTYSASFILALCEGTINNILTVYKDKAQTSTATEGMEQFHGTYPQTPWAYLTTNFPAQAFPYPGVAYVAQADYNLGSSANLPNYSIEVVGLDAGTSLNPYDADITTIIRELVSNVHWAIEGFSYLGDLSDVQNYLIAQGLAMSVLYDSQSAVNSMLKDISNLTCCEFVWSGKTLTLIPYANEAVVGHGAAWNPSPVQFDLTDDDFLPSGAQDGNTQAPIKITRKRISDSLNRINLEALDRHNQYNVVPIVAKDQASIDQYGTRDNGQAAAHCYCEPSIAQVAAQLILQRQGVQNTFTWMTDWRYVLLDCMDKVTLTHSQMGLDHVLVRITDIQESDDGDTLKFTAEEVLEGASTPALYSFQGSQGFAANYNVEPGNALAPFMFEPTDQLAGALEVWLATAGVDNWGGCEIWVSEDNITYNKAATRYGSSRYGVTTSALGSIARAVSGPSIDTTSTLGVDISATNQQLLSGSQTDAISLNTLCWVGGEYLAYETATLTAAGKYNLTYLNRGALGTQIQAHVAGENFVRLDSTLTKIPFRQDQIGKKIYVKLLSFNIYGGNTQSLQDVPFYQYTLTGLALTSPLPNIQNARAVYNDGFEEFYWDDIVDFRTGIRYRIYKGPDFAGAMQVGDNAHAPFKAFGSDTYWIQAYCQPVAGLYVTSNPVSLTISGNMLISNLVQTNDQQAEGWPGIFSSGVGRDGANIRLGGSGNILTVPNVLSMSDVLNYGGIISEGTYEVSSSDYIDVQYTAEAYVNAIWKSTGVPVGQDILTVPDVLSMPDFLGAASTQFINVKVQVAWADNGPGDIFAAPDPYSITDVYSYGIDFNDWQDYAPGVYHGRIFKFRLVLSSIDPSSIAEVLAFSYSISVKPRIDHYQNLNVGIGGLTITFVPDNSATGEAQPFNGGPPLGPANNSLTLFTQFEWAGNAAVNYVIDSISLSSMTFHFEDATHTHIAINGVSVQVEGY